jgi:hypothetical protein
MLQLAPPARCSLHCDKPPGVLARTRIELHDFACLRDGRDCDTRPALGAALSLSSRRLARPDTAAQSLVERPAHSAPPHERDAGPPDELLGVARPLCPPPRVHSRAPATRVASAPACRPGQSTARRWLKLVSWSSGTDALRGSMRRKCLHVSTTDLLSVPNAVTELVQGVGNVLNVVLRASRVRWAPPSR